MANRRRNSTGGVVGKAGEEGRGGRRRHSLSAMAIRKEDMDDDMDEFMKLRNKVQLEMAADESDETEEEEDTVMDIKHASDDASDEEDDDDDEEDDDAKDDGEEEKGGGKQRGKEAGASSLISGKLMKGRSEEEATDEDDEEEEEEEEDEDDDEEIGGLVAKMAKQAAYMKRKTALMEAKGEGEDEEEGEDGEEEEDKRWGKRKRRYYNADNVDYELTDDEDAPAEEEAEVLRLQRKMAAKLRAEDYGEDDDDDEEEEEEEEGEETLEEAVKRREMEKKGTPGKHTNEEDGEKRTKKNVDGKKTEKKKDESIEAMAASTNGAGAMVEKVAKDLNMLTEEEKMAAVMSDAPELVGLLAELRQGLGEVKHTVLPLLEQVKSNKDSLVTSDGISYLEAKHLLLLGYCQNIVFYILLKSEGRSVRDHPVIQRLVEQRLFLEKIRPIDKKLQYQLEKLLRQAREKGEGKEEEGVRSGEDAKGAAAMAAKRKDLLQFGPNPDLLMSKLDGDGGGGDGLYRPPMMMPTTMLDDERVGGKDAKAKARAEAMAKSRAARSAVIQELAEEIEGRPEEVRPVIGTESQWVAREKARLEARAAAEVSMFTRVSMTREEKKRMNAAKKAVQGGMMGMLDDLNDDVAGLVDAEDEAGEGGAGGGGGGGGGALDMLLRRRKLSQAIDDASRQPKKPRIVSGDADLPVRDDLGERRRKFETMSQGRSKQKDDGEEEEEERGRGGKIRRGEEDDVYLAAKELKERKKAEKEAKKLAARSAMSAAAAREEEGGDMEDGEKRNITREMETNRGLTPYRKKLTKNPRKKYKLKFEKAVTRRKGQVRDVKTAPGPYGGESTGIKTGISRSVRFRG